MRNNDADDVSYDFALDDPRCHVKTTDFEVVACWPHGTDAFTEGLEIYNGVLYESTGGRNGTHPPVSTLRRVGLRTGIVLELITLNDKYFAEGLTIFGGRVFQLTLDSGAGFIYDVNKLSDPPDMFKYNGWDEGWGITNDASNLIISDGSAELHFVDPVDFQIKRSVQVHYKNDYPQDQLNELEYFNGSIYANVHDEDRIVCINPLSGEITTQIDISSLHEPNCILCEPNGIAYDKDSDHLFVTGKNWSKIFEIRLI